MHATTTRYVLCQRLTIFSQALLFHILLVYTRSAVLSYIKDLDKQDYIFPLHALLLAPHNPCNVLLLLPCLLLATGSLEKKLRSNLRGLECLGLVVWWHGASLASRLFQCACVRLCIFVIKNVVYVVCQLLWCIHMLCFFKRNRLSCNVLIY